MSPKTIPPHRTNGFRLKSLIFRSWSVRRVLFLTLLAILGARLASVPLRIIAASAAPAPALGSLADTSTPDNSGRFVDRIAQFDHSSDVFYEMLFGSVANASYAVSLNVGGSPPP